MDALRKAPLGGKTHMGGGDAPASLLFTLLIRGQLHTPVPLFQRTAKNAFHPAAMIFTRPIRSRLSSWTHCERTRLAVRRTWGSGGAPASLLFTLLIRGQLHTPVPLFQRTRQKGLHPAAMIFTMPIRSRLTSWTNFERSRLAVRPIPRRPWPGSSRSLPCRKSARRCLGASLVLMAT